jgi:hypothetical protein
MGASIISRLPKHNQTAKKWGACSVSEYFFFGTIRDRARIPILFGPCWPGQFHGTIQIGITIDAAYFSTTPYIPGDVEGLDDFGCVS